MSDHKQPAARHRLACRLYAACLVALPRGLRDKHGAAMVDLFARNLERSASAGVAAAVWTAIRSIGDLLRRGVIERIAEERAELTAPSVVVFGSLAKTYLATCALLTGLLLILSLRNRVPVWQEQDMSFATMVESIVLSIPFIAALTLPMAVFIAVLHVIRNPTDNVDPRAASGSAPIATRVRLVPLLALASVLALFAFVWNAEVVPRTNARLSSMNGGAASATRNDRSMTFGELRIASQRASQRAAEPATQQSGVVDIASLRTTAASLEVELHKKPALAAACVVFALLAFAMARIAPRAGVLGQSLASLAVFSAYYVLLMTGETFADRLVLSPGVAMWSANVLLFLVAVMTLRYRAHYPLRFSPHSIRR